MALFMLPMRPATTKHFELLVIGAGQGGIPLANSFARTGRRVALVERAHVGGTCINEGCSPTKTVIASARVAHLTRRSATYGVQLAVGSGLLEQRVRHARLYSGDCFGPRQCCSLAGREEWRLAPDGDRSEALLRLAVPPSVGPVHVDAVCAAVDVAGAELHELDERRRERRTPHVRIESRHRLDCPLLVVR
jgi:choline dehydrogenase-like flavoprotein